MPYCFKNWHIDKIAVIGAGQIGPDIALHFAKSLAPHSVQIAVIDISAEALTAAQNKVEAKIQKGLDSGAFKPNQAEAIRSALHFSLNYDDIREAQIAVEAATEDTRVKDAIFRRVESLTGETCIFLSNSSHLQPEVIFQNVRQKSRCLVAHYFFPAEINPVVEIVPGAQTDPALAERLQAFYESIGKIPIRVNSAYGYAIDPIFEGLCQTAIQCLEKGWGNEKEIDAAAVRALGLGVGPFTALNLTGGNPITAHGLDELGRQVMPWFKTPALLREKTERREPWNTARRGETVELDAKKEARLVATFQGAYFALAGFMLDSGIVEAGDLNMACELALVIKPPLAYMNTIGMEKAYALVNAFCAENPDFLVPKSLEKARKSGAWALRDIVVNRHRAVCVITIRRPKVMNALNLGVLAQIREVLEGVRSDSAIQAVVVTGFGVKAFVSGADLNMITALKTPEEGVQNSRDFQAALDYIADYPKPVVCALNGFAFGGGSEMAMACTARIARKGLSVVFSQPEVNLGFIPGAGATQRLPRLVGVEKAAEILRTGRQVFLKEALEMGYLDAASDDDKLLEEAAALALELAEGNRQQKILPRNPLPLNGQPRKLELGHLSRKIDEIMVASIYHGASLTLKEGLALESKMFGECLRTDDMKIGLEHFRTHGPKTPASFVHH
ncbi:MAG: Fatty acid oxidation complex subunit alpha [Saprospiraceae bacterium]|nr:Fatty acid oxidation complex subunit alpha [Saprospiraceae bacterium]